MTPRGMSVVTFLLLVVLTTSLGCMRPRERAVSGETMGTTFTVKVVTTPGSGRRSQLAKLPDTVHACLDSVNQKMSTWLPDSELSRFNQYEGSEPFQMSRETLRVIRHARRVSEVSGGAFDITVGPLVNAWGFGPEEGILEGPSDAELAALRERVGYDKLEVDLSTSTVRKTRPDIYCDLSAIAKGYAVDKVAAALDDLGFENYMVEVGGEVKANGVNAKGIPWQIGIERPVPGARAVHKVVPLSGMAMATSGDYRNYYEKDGIRLSHTIDPRTGRPVAHKLASVSVVHKECAWADAYATALMVLGPDAGYALAVKEDLAAFFIVHEGSRAFSEKATPAFEKLVEGPIGRVTAEK